MTLGIAYSKNKIKGGLDEAHPIDNY